MSWKATAYVKELRRNLTVVEKFVLLILAEYHRTDGKNEWPSTETLARDCLLTERAVRAIISRLIEKEFLSREKGGGRGHVSSYRILGLEKKEEVQTGNIETLIPETGIQRGKLTTVNPVSPRPPNKVLPVLETYGKTGCKKCGGTGKLHQLPHLPGPRLIDCNACSPKAVAK